VDSETIAALCEVGWAYRHAEKQLPDHLKADLWDAVNAEGIHPRLRSDVLRLLRSEP